MRTWAHWTAKTVMLTASFAAAGAGFSGMAFAATSGGTGGGTSGLGSVLGGNQASAPVSIPANVCGNAAAVLGIGLAGCGGGASTQSGLDTSGALGSTSGNGSVGGGNQVSAPVSVPVNVCGNAIGNAVAGCHGSAAVSGHGVGGSGTVTSGDGSVLGGNQVSAPVSAPANVCGNAAAVLGDSAAGCEGTVAVRRGAMSGLPSQSASSGLTDLAAPSAVSAPSGDSSTGGKAMPANALAADSASGMGSVSFYSLAIGALMAGAVALKLAGRRIRGHKA